ncbi:MAG: 4-hydroxy-3-methylbut-2-enyl diphosphate reductase [bacterium]|nr:4-hydroxy-3-methylbut-2-enyl diphosphate reductase [bacterium]
MSDASQNLLLASPRGFCAGVDRAIEIVELALKVYGKPVYVRHEIVHNRHVVEALREKGAVFTEDLAGIPEGSLVIFSAHGIAPHVREEAKARGLRTLDATCPLVTKVHVEARHYARDGCDIVLVGHRGHVEVEGTLGHAPDRMHLVETIEDIERLEVEDPDRLAVLTQTTLSLDDTREILEALRRRFPNIRLPSKDDICYATQNRQNAVKELAARAERVIVVGAPISSNSNRLVEVAQAHGAKARLVESDEAIDPNWITPGTKVGVSAGASTPEFLVTEVIEKLQTLGCGEVERLALVEEDVSFNLPPELKRELRNAASK